MHALVDRMTAAFCQATRQVEVKHVPAACRLFCTCMQCLSVYAGLRQASSQASLTCILYCQRASKLARCVQPTSEPRGPLSLLVVSSLHQNPSLSGACVQPSLEPFSFWCLSKSVLPSLPISEPAVYITHCFQARKELGIYVRPVEETIIDWALTLFQLGLASPVPKGR